MNTARSFEVVHVAGGCVLMDAQVSGFMFLWNNEAASLTKPAVFV